MSLYSKVKNFLFPSTEYKKQEFDRFNRYRLVDRLHDNACKEVKFYRQFDKKLDNLAFEDVPLKIFISYEFLTEGRACESMATNPGIMMYDGIPLVVRKQLNKIEF